MKVPDTNPTDPMEAARRFSRPVLPKRFYAHAETVAEEEGSLSASTGRQRGRRPRNRLLISAPRLAEAVAAEWNAQGEHVDPATMPATRLANTAIDGVAHRLDEVRGEILSYGGTDLLFYRAGEPEGLVARQREAWDPILRWAEERLGARFILAEGVIHVAQPDRTLAALSVALAGYDEPFRLAALHVATTLTGSALIALALAEGALGVEAAWAAAHVDEDWNISQWGADAEALERRARRYMDFSAAGLALALSHAAGLNRRSQIGRRSARHMSPLRISGDRKQAPAGRSMRMASARALLRQVFRIARPRRVYEPVEIGRRRYQNKRDADLRWQAIAAAIRQYEARSVLDIGCAEGWFLRRAAEDFGCFAIGIDGDDRRVMLGEVARLHDGVERVAVMKGTLAPDDIRRLPPCDLVLCLSVVHHVYAPAGWRRRKRSCGRSPRAPRRRCSSRSARPTRKS